MPAKNRNILDKAGGADSESCSVCRDLLVHMERFFDILQSSGRPSSSDWLTVGEIASELKISKTIVYRLIHHGELEAVNIVENNGKIAQKGHYRIKRSSMNDYIKSKRVRPFPNGATHTSRPRRFPKVKNHLGL